MAFVNKLNNNIKTLLSFALMGLVCLGLGPVGSSVQGFDSYLAISIDAQSSAGSKTPDLSSPPKSDTATSPGYLFSSSRSQHQQARAGFCLAQRILFAKAVRLPVLLRHQYRQVFNASDPDSALS